MNWLIACFGFNGTEYFSLYQAVSQTEGERGEKRVSDIGFTAHQHKKKRREKIEESEKVQTSYSKRLALLLSKL